MMMIIAESVLLVPPPSPMEFSYHRREAFVKAHLVVRHREKIT